MTTEGLSVKSLEAANSGGFIWMFPLTFVSSAFVDPDSMPGWLQPVANNNPFTIVTNATRALYNGIDPAATCGCRWPGRRHHRGVRGARHPQVLVLDQPLSGAS